MRFGKEKIILEMFSSKQFCQSAFGNNRLNQKSRWERNFGQKTKMLTVSIRGYISDHLAVLSISPTGVLLRLQALPTCCWFPATGPQSTVLTTSKVLTGISTDQLVHPKVLWGLISSTIQHKHSIQYKLCSYPFLLWILSLSPIERTEVAKESKAVGRKRQNSMKTIFYTMHLTNYKQFWNSLEDRLFKVLTRSP